MKSRSDEPRMNEQIRVDQVRLVGADGEMVGVVSTNQAQDMAREAGMDLVEVSPDAAPPVCKILDYGKYKYQQQKRASEARKKQKVVALKEIKLRPTIEQNDLDTKMKNVHKFLDAGDKVKFSLRFRRREMSHQDLGRELLNKIKDDLGDLVKIENHPRLEGRQMIMIVAPNK